MAELKATQYKCKLELCKLYIAPAELAGAGLKADLHQVINVLTVS